MNPFCCGIIEDYFHDYSFKIIKISIWSSQAKLSRVMSVLVLEKDFVAGQMSIFKSRVLNILQVHSYNVSFVVTVYCQLFKDLFIVFCNAILHVFWMCHCPVINLKYIWPVQSTQKNTDCDSPVGQISRRTCDFGNISLHLLKTMPFVDVCRDAKNSYPSTCL